jgi:hypothetical protein
MGNISEHRRLEEAKLNETLKTCETCYEEYPEGNFYGLECAHTFCKLCM